MTCADDVFGKRSVYEQVSEVPGLTIHHPGFWEVPYHARTGLTAAGGVTTTVFKNGNLIDGSEAIRASAEGQGTIGQRFMHTFVRGDIVTLHVYRFGGGGIYILSNTDGRTAVMAHWVRETWQPQ
ncbi:hypothetical protein AB0I53_33870 [Saccharopolyspora sp. NPDC050389]|uniref:hypothetical protein n=1 Tax=Saccharopolyspora sp. NPDC050389 TaxID=3155516 RepID=UPI0033DF05FE